MGAATFTPTKDETLFARIGVEMQAEGAGLDLEDPKVKKFVDQMVQTRAAHIAESRFLQTIIDRVTEQGHWAPGGCKHVHQPEETNNVNS